jgi:hypothetical protein
VRARARPCAARPRLFGLIATPNGALRTPPRPSQLRCFLFYSQKYIKSVELWLPTLRAFFFPQEHIGYEILGPPAPCIAHRSFANPSGNTVFWGQNYVPVPPYALIFVGFSFLLDLFFLLFFSLSTLLFNIFLFFSSYLVLFFSS